MIDLETIDKVYLYPGSTDLRKGMNALSYLVGELEKEEVNIDENKKEDSEIINIDNDEHQDSINA